MSTVLVTGARGLVGRSVTTALRAGGWDVRGFDLTDGDDLHADDVAHAVVLALTRPVPRHSRLTLCGPGPFDTAAARRTLGWTPAHDSWPTT